MFWNKKKSALDKVFDFRKDHKPMYTNADLDAALNVILYYEEVEENKNERFVKAATQIAENWKQWLIDKGVKRQMKVEIERFSNPICLPRVYLSVSNGEENDVFDVKLGFGYNDQVMKLAEFCKRAIENNHGLRTGSHSESSTLLDNVTITYKSLDDRSPYDYKTRCFIS